MMKIFISMKMIVKGDYIFFAAITTTNMKFNRLSQLPETQREAILFERSEERKRIQERNQLRRALRQKTNTVVSDKKRETKSRAAKESDGRKSKALDDIVARREKKQSTKRSHLYDDEDEYIDDEYYSKKSSKKSHVSSEDVKEMLDKIQYKDLLKVQVTRSDLETWIDEPYWDKVIRNLFVRIGVGESDSKGYVYRVAEIVEPVDLGGKEYKLGKKRTSLCLKLSIAGSMKDFQMEYVSNKPFTEEEFEVWKKTMLKHNYEPPTPKQLDSLVKNINFAKNYVYTEEDIEKMIEQNRKNAIEKGLLIDSKSIMSLKRQLKSAKERNDTEEIESLKKKLNDIYEIQKKKIEERYKNVPNIEAINRKNKEINSGKIFKQKKESSSDENIKSQSSDEISGKKILSLTDYIKLKGIK